MNKKSLKKQNFKAKLFSLMSEETRVSDEFSEDLNSFGVATDDIFSFLVTVTAARAAFSLSAHWSREDGESDVKEEKKSGAGYL